MRPAENSTTSPTRCLPEARWISPWLCEFPEISICATASPQRKTTSLFRIWWISSSTISLVEELERPRPLIDHRHLHAERGEHRRVLDADHARADDDHRPRQLFEAEDRVGGRDGLAVDLHAGRLAGHRADGDEDVLGGQAACAGRRLHDAACAGPRRRRGRASRRTSLRDITSCTMSTSRSMTRATWPTSCAIVGRPRSRSESVGLEPGARVDAPDRFAERLRRDGARVDAHAARRSAGVR